MSTFQNQNARIAAAVGAGLGASLLAVYALNHWRKQHQYWNSSFVEAGRVDRLFIHPIKSCRGVEVSYVDCSTRGPRNGFMCDREFLVIDEDHDGIFLTARTYPKMVLVEVEREAEKLVVKFPTGRSVEVDLEEARRRNVVKTALLHEKTRTDGIDCGDEIGQAFTEYLEVEGKRKLRLLRFSPAVFSERNQSSHQRLWLNPAPKVDDHIMYSDQTSYMINTNASLKDLNTKLEADGIPPVEIRNFRPVISVDETPAFDEDRWLEVRIGDAEFVCFRPCARCVLTTVNPDEGTLSKEMQPLKKLREYRLAPGRLHDVYKQSPLFGVHLALRRPGRIRVGDTVYARYKPSPF